MQVKQQLSNLVRWVFVALSLLTIVATYGFYKNSVTINKINQEAQFYSSSVAYTLQANLAFKRQVQEWKDILLRGNDQEMYDKYLSQFSAREAEVGATLGLLKTKLLTHGDDTSKVDKLMSAHQALGTRYRDALATNWSSGDNDAGKKVDAAVKGIDRDASSQLDDVVKKMQERSTATMATLQKDGDAEARLILISFAAIAVLASFLLLRKATMITRGVVGLLGAEPEALVIVFEAMAAGNLAVDVPLKAGDTKSMTAQIGLMQRKLKNMMRAVQGGAAELETLAATLDDDALALTPKQISVAARKAVKGLNTAVDRFQVTNNV